MAVSNPYLYVNGGDGASTGYYALTAWATATAKTVGQIVRQLATPAAGSERVFICIVAGTTHASTEPTWVLTAGAKTTDNTVTWMECSGLAALNGDQTNVYTHTQFPSAAVSLGQIIKNVANTFLFICTTAGSTAAGEPTWNTTTGVTTADNTVTWTCIGAISAFAKWAAPHRSLKNAIGGANALAVWTHYLSAIHTESWTGTQTWSGANTTGVQAATIMTCIAQAGSIPPGSADVTTGAALTATSTATLGASGDWTGIKITGSSVTIGSSITGLLRFSNCQFVVTGAGNNVGLGVNAAGVELIGTTMQWTSGSSSGNVVFNGGWVRWRDTSAALTYAVQPTVVFTNSSGGAGVFEIEGVDLVGFTGTTLASLGGYASRLVLTGCKLHANVVTLDSTSPGSPTGLGLDLINCDSGGAIYRHERWTPMGHHGTDATVYRSGGASDGTTPIGWKIVTYGLYTTFDFPFETLPLVIWNATTASPVTLTVEGLYNGAALPNNDEAWLEALFFGTAASTLLSRVTDAKTNILATAAPLTASSATWTATGRANSTAYVTTTPSAITASSNTGRVFVCTTSGTSSGSLPGAYASAVDGGSVTDGTAVFRAAMRFQVAVTCTSPQSAGFIRALCKVAKASGTFWLDPYMTVT